jgi:DNA-binding NarL/FixJ family response regulator
VEALGHEVVGMATNGKLALEGYEQTRPDLILMDVEMPELDGLSCTTMLAQRDPQVRVLIVTGSRCTPDDARQAGARGYLPKPFGLEELAQSLQTAVAA